ncbi:hypothetical protein B0H14DRAFT_3491883 [Mycena olivaceomarginata]|nr:hypothetical protein B0H14DRAFT_3491883 [Mycena olivaceomarginata]
MEILGAGNYGVVYKALDTTSPPTDPIHYAVKCLGVVAPNATQGSHQDEREIALHTRAASSIVLELSAGGNLFDAIDTGVFRDNDTFNILCSADGGDIRIADFGLATDCAFSSSTGGSFAPSTPTWAFLTNDGHLRYIFPISDALNELLERYFRPLLHTHPTLLQLRTKIAAMGRYYRALSGHAPAQAGTAPQEAVAEPGQTALPLHQEDTAGILEELKTRWPRRRFGVVWCGERSVIRGVFHSEVSISFRCATPADPSVPD